MKDPSEEKYRVIKLTNGAYMKRVANVGGGRAFHSSTSHLNLSHICH
jgi:hypothetical protein